MDSQNIFKTLIHNEYSTGCITISKLIVCLSFLVIGLACSHSKPKIADVQENMSVIDQRIERLRLAQEQERQKRKEILSEIRELVQDNSPIIKERQSMFEKSANRTTARSGDIQSVPIESKPKESEEKSISITTTRRASDAEELFNNAYANYNHGEYSTAAEGFLLAYGLADSTDLGARCLYWLGECHYRNHQWEKAVTCFTELEKQFSNHSILSSALLKKGYAQIQQGNMEKGKLTLHHLLNKFPLSEEAPLAKGRLRELGDL